MNLDDNTKKNIADALWLKEYDEKKIDKTILAQIHSEKNSNAEIGVRMRAYLNWLAARPQSHNPSYKKRYSLLKSLVGELNAQQAYVIATKFLGQNSTQGFEAMPEHSTIKLPRDHAPQLRSQVGWHFFVGSGWDAKGEEYGIEMMFFRVALLPPILANSLGISDIENQVVELQFGISKAGDKHYQTDPVVVAGTTGLIQLELDPMHYKLGHNEIRANKKGQFFPMSIAAHGIDRGEKDEIELGAELEFSSGKETLMQGANGCMPCVDGMGTLYYSIPNVVLKSGTIIYKGEKIKLAKGTFWFDHQWGSFGGNPHSSVLRAANNTSKPGPAGWDWYMAQFVGNRQITMFAQHSKAYERFYFQTGEHPPEPMVIDVAGKYMDENKKTSIIWGKLTIDEWVKSEASPNKKLYPVTHTWHPNSWKFSFDNKLPEDIRDFSMTQIVEKGQANFFANGSQYNEGAVILRDDDGKDIGRGFAEAVQYADTSENMARLAGLEPTAKVMRLFEQAPSLPRRLYNMLYVIIHQKQLAEILKTAQGLEFFAKSKPKKLK